MENLEHVNRIKKDGFKKYFVQRQAHFTDIYHCDYTKENVLMAWKESMALIKKCKSGDSRSLLD